MSSYSFVVTLTDEFRENYYVTFCKDQEELVNLLLNLSPFYKLVSVEETWAVVSTNYKEFLKEDNNLEFGRKEG